MNILDSDEFLAAINRDGVVLTRDSLKRQLAPILLKLGDAKMVGTGKRATLIFDGNRVWYWREYLAKRKALIEMGCDKWHSKRAYDEWDADLLVSQAIYDGELDHPAFNMRIEPAGDESRGSSHGA